MPIPIRSDRSAHDNVNYPHLHSRDLDDEAPLHHLPTATGVGQIPSWDGEKWISSSAGAGDMVKAVYDANDNGTIDDSENLEGHPASYFATSDHTHEGGDGHTIEDETTPMTQRSKLSFQGDVVAVTDDGGNDRTIVTITGGSDIPAAIKIYMNSNFV